MKINRKRISESLKRRAVNDIIRSTLLGIKRPGGDPYDWDDPWVIKPFLHKTVISGDWKVFDARHYKIMQDMFGRSYTDYNFVPAERMPNYQKKCIWQLPDFEIIQFSFPIDFQPPYRIEIYPRENVSPRQFREFIQLLDSSLTILHLSSVEYAVDLYCHDREAVQRLFVMLRRYSHIPYQRYAKLLGENHIDWGNNTRMNAVYRAGNIKIYERGPDGKKTKHYWKLEDCDRVRLERSASRDTLRKHGIYTVSDLIKQAKFHEINGDVYKFKCFEGSKKLPKCWEGYRTTDKYGNMNCLQLEINHGRQRVKNINQYMRDVEEFRVLRKTLSDVMKKFDEEWMGF